KVAVVTNAKDYKTPQEREVKVKELLEYLSDLGLRTTEVDLRKYFSNHAALEKTLKKYQAIWLAGGNVFLLRRALKQSGLDKILYDKVRKNELIYGGESAGAIVAGPTLKFSEMEGDEDDPQYIAEGYDSKVLWDGLNFVNYVPVPHYLDSDYGADIDEYIERLNNAGIAHKNMTNAQAIIINGDKEEFLK
ncbi:MAG TPA: Type 1 glutamine amidotransferase-like domain-containing protein, partial [Chitinophagaceae bacterium]|nr:Type 1 glutamine amidotransferase-like domain-containing protein [Chitinophagaceae bacterium]